MRKFLGKLGKALLGPLHRELGDDLDHRASKEAQLLLYHSYREMAARGGALPRFAGDGTECMSANLVLNQGARVAK